MFSGWNTEKYTETFTSLKLRKGNGTYMSQPYNVIQYILKYFLHNNIFELYDTQEYMAQMSYTIYKILHADKMTNRF